MNTQINEDSIAVIDTCRNIFVEKLKDYGPTWLLVRFTSIIDELWRKIKRIRTLEENGDNSKIPEGRDVEYIGIVNYSIIAIMRLLYGEALPDGDEIYASNRYDVENLHMYYDDIAKNALDLLARKNHDYGDAWREMELTSLTDQIVVKVYRIKNILHNDGTTKISEGMDAQLYDIINYCVFSLIRMKQENAI